MALDSTPAVTRLGFPMAACPCLGVSERAICRVKASGLTRTDMQARFLLPSHAGFFVWSNSNVSSSLFTSTLIHHLLSSQEAGRREAVASVESVLGGQCGWVINQTASTQPPNTLTRQGIYIPLHTCQEIAQQWIITADHVLWRGERACRQR